MWRLGWTLGGGVEVPIAPHWTARLEYLFKDYGRFTWLYSGGAQPISSDLTLNEVGCFTRPRTIGNHKATADRFEGDRGPPSPDDPSAVTCLI